MINIVCIGLEHPVEFYGLGLDSRTTLIFVVHMHLNSSAKPACSLFNWHIQSFRLDFQARPAFTARPFALSQHQLE